MAGNGCHVTSAMAEPEILARNVTEFSPSIPLKVVVIGGGTGLSTLLRGLKKHVAAGPGPHQELDPPISPRIGELTAIVTVTDDGGSSGRLREELNMLPPGDIRNCLVALSDDEALLSNLFQYRFSRGGSLQGHSFGNLFLAALTGITNDFAEAVRLSSAILSTRGKILPATLADVHLVATMEDGIEIRGETNITACHGKILQVRIDPVSPEPSADALSAIAEADVITIGPGSLFTSLVPNLLVRGIPEALETARGLKILIANLMTQPCESLGLSVSDHISALYCHANLPFLDCVLVNDAPIPQEIVERYQSEGTSQVLVDESAIASLGVEVLRGDFLAKGPLVRHAADHVADVILGILGPIQQASLR